MENEKEKQHFIIWLYISILLHLLMVIIMLSIKPTTSSADPDPARLDYDATKIMFVQDDTTEPEPHELQQQPQMATRTQGGEIISPQHSPEEPKPVQQDIPEPALSDDYKKGIHNQTNIQDQDEDGQVNIVENAIIDELEQLEKQVIPQSPAIATLKEQDEPTVTAAPTNFTDITQQQERPIPSAEILKTIISELNKAAIAKQEKQKEASDTQELPQSQIQKITSKKHRPADLGIENLSKVQLSKQTQTITPTKKKLSLQDLQAGFSQFLQHGNEQYFSVQGNAQLDDAESLKRASYYRQLGQMYKNASAMAPNLFSGTHHEKPTNNSVLQITIERSGKISNTQIITNCGVDALDRHHIKIVESIGSFPPIPKYIEAPLHISATLQFFADRSSSGTFAPIMRRK